MDERFDVDRGRRGEGSKGMVRLPKAGGEEKGKKGLERGRITDLLIFYFFILTG